MGYSTSYELEVSWMPGKGAIPETQKLENLKKKLSKASSLEEVEKLLHSPDIITDPHEIIPILLEECDGASYALDEEGDTNDSCKWYDHDQDMKKFSKKYPDFLFTLKGSGEETGDMWVTYYNSGKMQHCPAKITFDPFDPNQLI